MEKNTLNTSISIVLLLALLVIGCSKTGDSSQPSISVFPEILDFGKVRPTDSPIKLTLDLYNNSSRSVVIADIFSGCGCTIIDIPQEPILSGEKMTIPVSVHVWGRSGLFENDLIIKTTAEHLVTIPIRGTIETDIWTDGQALRCTAGAMEPRASTVLTVYTVKYPDIVFSDFQANEGIMLKEISRMTKDGETAIRFSVDVDIEPNSAMMKNINIVPADSHIAPIAVPFYCQREG